ncbi:protein kinase domain-containing protein [Citrus sinensis]|uniref:Protein kinase domain-containing protein n=3 Tax=Citrus sinensis TaxID=2711 RepID=A0ACB8NMH6_CITSI|nr:probable receptor-like protein kinase At1g80640 [Citrus sinensis]KAH9760477.1 protein kinase domain-containing protein [Citrus sinensis]KAH9798913.1 protein kinase domain-containing protein [Citrus sinensis]KDO46785.1 hypothetical protein CISIN_1g012975mg [Citrus sinensis]GAY45921.1 hypothetical protein CUMW_093050 [Citrus unshiu]
MKLLLILFVVLFVFLHQSFWIHASIEPLPGPLVFSPLISPVSTSMAAFSPGIQMGSEDPHHHHMDAHHKLLIALIIACSALCLIILALLCLWLYHLKYSFKSSNKNAKSKDSENGVVLSSFLGKFTSVRMVSKKGSAISFIEYKLLEKATDSFHESNILGEGGFGCVYKAKLDDNLHVAVKKLDCATQDAGREFENEVDLLSNIHHPNVVCLLGYSAHDDTRFIVYELMENRSLDIQLHGPSHGSALTWHMRMKIALDTARGLEYLHEHCNPAVIHRDLKSSNILLDSKFNAKLSDFGLAITDGSQNKNNLKLSGTLGYVAPEYLLDGKLTDKSDVYAFGVVLLELLLGRRPVEKLAPAQCQSIVTWAMPQLTDRSKLPNIVDPVIKSTMDLKHLYQVAAVAVLCVQPEPSYRPLITDVLHSLIPLVPVELGGTLRVAPSGPPADSTIPSGH